MGSTAHAHFTFTKLVVADLDRCAAFYRSAFGVHETARIESDIAGRAIEEILFAPAEGSGATFVLLRYLDTDIPASDETILGFLTTDADALIGRVVAAGGTVASEAQARPDLGVKVGFVRDVEGHLIEIVERVG
jgi:predicted enzyme related to lactoylglutathione lyase